MQCSLFGDAIKIGSCILHHRLHPEKAEIQGLYAKKIQEELTESHPASFEKEKVFQFPFFDRDLNVSIHLGVQCF